MVEKAFKTADIAYLRSVAKGIGADLAVPPDIRQAQALKDKGVPVPGELDPEEAFWLLQITKRIQEGAVVPHDIAVYLNDRTNSHLPEDNVPVVLARQRRTTFNELMHCLTELTKK